MAWRTRTSSKGFFLLLVVRISATTLTRTTRCRRQRANRSHSSLVDTSTSSSRRCVGPCDDALLSFLLLTYSRCNVALGRVYISVKVHFFCKLLVDGPHSVDNVDSRYVVMLLCRVVFAEESSGSPWYRRQRRVVHVRG